MKLFSVLSLLLALMFCVNSFEERWVKVVYQSGEAEPESSSSGESDEQEFSADVSTAKTEPITDDITMETAVTSSEPAKPLTTKKRKLRAFSSTRKVLAVGIAHFETPVSGNAGHYSVKEGSFVYAAGHQSEGRIVEFDVLRGLLTPANNRLVVYSTSLTNVEEPEFSVAEPDQGSDASIVKTGADPSSRNSASFQAPLTTRSSWVQVSGGVTYETSLEPTLLQKWFSCCFVAPNRRSHVYRYTMEGLYP